MMPEKKTSEAPTMPLLPQLPSSLRPGECLQTVAEAAMMAHEDVMEMQFEGSNLEGMVGSALEFTGCLFKNCRFLSNEIKRISFVDCVFDHGDFSNETFCQATFQRVQFAYCRMTGMELTQASLMNTTIQNCQMEYSSFADTKLDRVWFQDCRIRESFWSHVTFSRTGFLNCDFSLAQWTHTALAGLDMRHSEILGWTVDPQALRGLTVTALQAIELSRLMGIKICE